MTAVYFLQLVTAAVLAVKRFAFAALLLPLLVLTATFHVTVSKLFARPWTLTSLREAAALDAREASKARAGDTRAAAAAASPRPLATAPPAPTPDRPPTPPPPHHPQAITPEEQAALKALYLNPAFKLDAAEHEELLANARAVRGAGVLRARGAQSRAKAKAREARAGPLPTRKHTLARCAPPPAPAAPAPQIDTQLKGGAAGPLVLKDLEVCEGSCSAPPSPHKGAEAAA